MPDSAAERPSPARGQPQRPISTNVSRVCNQEVRGSNPLGSTQVTATHAQRLRADRADRVPRMRVSRRARTPPPG
jgi:hypothetical protein